MTSRPRDRATLVSRMMIPREKQSLTLKFFYFLVNCFYGIVQLRQISFKSAPVALYRLLQRDFYTS
ncbi:MAG: hypothetical protein RMX68_014920 [Aulosira sp. ZfuVER01]|nr:hypothetical protein [Aulosira sp. ZfuVER01]MDZ7998754.1 hypothetical protein [Aulosira sp. DedVER01a]MDZ8053930.1 hypothetical protein [Aulosira sp. ZfuCHP01]